MADFATLVFLLGQLGISLGLGAATFSLMFYFVATADGRIDPTESRFVAATRIVLVASLFLIVVTGGLVTAAHILAGERDIVMAPVYLGKWALIGVLIFSGLFHRLSLISAPVAGVISGASWYALFIVHTLAPQVSWGVLGIGYALWLGAFAIGFALVGKAARETPYVAPVQSPRPSTVVQKPASAKPALPQKPAPLSVGDAGPKASAPHIDFDLSKGSHSH